MNVDVVAIDPDPAAPGLALATYAYVHDLANEDEILAIARKHRIDGVMTIAADYPMPTIAALCATLNLPGPSPTVVTKSTNKRLMRLALSAYGVACPRFFNAESLENARNAAENLGTDAIFKPAVSQGGRGVTRVPAGASNTAIEQAFQRAQRETRGDGVMVEEFIEGPEFSIESLTHQGNTHIIAVTDKLTSGPPYFVELGHSQPSRWPAEQVKALCHTADQALAALGVDQTAGHTEIRFSSRGPVIMEVAARLGGGFINSHLVPLSTGIDLVAATIQVALGDPPDLRPRFQGRAAAIRFLSAQPGIVTRIEGVEIAKQLTGVEEVDVYARTQDSIPPLVDATGRPGHVICSAATPELAIDLAERAARSIEILTVGKTVLR